MARTSSVKSSNGVRVVVVGDPGTGKSSLILTAAAERFLPNVPPVLPPTRLLLPSADGIPLTIIDTSSSTERSGKLVEELRKADAVILTYACHIPETLDRLGTIWLPKLQGLEVKVPVVVVGCMLDRRDENKDFDLQEVMSPIMQQFLEIETCMECSALGNTQVAEVFYYAQRSVLCPIAPLFDQETNHLNTRCIRALKRIFILCDHDKDGALSDKELNEFQSIELTNEALDFLEKIFFTYDVDRDGYLRVSEVEEFFSTAPENPWRQAPYRDAVERNPFGGLTLDGFLSEWSLMALLDPTFCVENLLYIGYAGDPQSAICVTQRRRLDCKTQQSNRNVFQCFVFGPKKAGKTALLNSLIKRRFLEEDVPDSDYHYAVNVVDRPGGKKKTLVLREIQEDGIKEFLSKGDVLPRCDVAVFVHDSSCESSWKKATELLFDVASRGEATGYGFPCLVIAAKDDLDQYPNQVQDSARVCRELGIEAPIPVSTKLGDLSDIFSKIVRAAEQPHLSIPETEAGRRCKHYHQLVNRSLKFVSVGAAVTFVGLVAYRAYAARRNSSG